VLNLCLFVKITAKSGPSNTAATHGLCGLDIVSDYLFTPSLGPVGQLTRQQQERLDAFRKRAKMFGFCDENYTIAELLDKADARLLVLHRMHGIDAAYCYTRCGMACLCVSVCLYVTRTNPAKTAEPIKMPLDMWTRVDPIKVTMY